MDLFDIQPLVNRSPDSLPHTPPTCTPGVIWLPAAGAIRRCARVASSVGLPLIGNGDVFSPMEWQQRLAAVTAEGEDDGTEGGAAAAAGGGDGCGVSTAMIGRAALIKPWIFTGVCVCVCVCVHVCVCVWCVCVCVGGRHEPGVVGVAVGGGVGWGGDCEQTSGRWGGGKMRGCNTSHVSAFSEQKDGGWGEGSSSREHSH